MIKRISHISLCFLLLVSTAGFAVSKHYCGDALIDVAFNENADPCCDSGDCCHSETIVHKLDTDYAAPQVSAVPVVTELTVLGHDLLIADEISEQELPQLTLTNNLSPPESVLEFLSLRQVFLL